jgi:hypothetical protein
MRGANLVAGLAEDLDHQIGRVLVVLDDDDAHCIRF